MKSLIVSFIKDEDGQTSTEYILLIAVVALIVFKFKSVATKKLDEITNAIFDKAGGIANEIDGP